MFDPHQYQKIMRYLTWTFILIIFMLITGIAIAGEKEYYSKIKPVNPEEVNGQFCYIKVVIRQKDDEIIKEEILECADGRNRFDGPSYWELFAQFYYRDVNTPEYCRFYSRPGHAFKSFGKACMNKDGEWEVR
jgi:hypothetical protein